MGYLFSILLFLMPISHATACMKFGIGKEEVLSFEDGFSSAQFSEDGKSILGIQDAGNILIENLQTRKVKSIRAPDGFSFYQFSLDGKQAVGNSDKEAIIKNLQTGEQKIFPSVNNVWRSFTSDGKKLIGQRIDGSKKSILYDIDRNNEIVLDDPKKDYFYDEFSPDASQAVAISNTSNSTIILHDFTSGDTKELNFKNGFGNPQFSLDGKKLFGISRLGQIILHNLNNTDKDTILNPPAGSIYTQISKDGKIAFGSIGNKKNFVQNLETGNITQISQAGDLGIYDISPDGTTTMKSINQGKVIIRNLEQACNDNLFSILQDSIYCNKDSPIQAFTSFSQTAMDLQCKSVADPKTWAPIKIPNQLLSPELAKNYLVRFQKIGGFDPKKHLAIFLAMLKNPNILNVNQELISGALQTILHESSILYDDIIDAFPTLLSLRSFENNPCRTKEEQLTIKNDILAYIKLKVDKKDFTTLNDWNHLNPFSKIIAQFSETEKHDQIDLIATAMSNEAIKDAMLKGSFLSKIYSFCYQEISPYFGVTKKPLTDLTLIREKNKIIPLLLGVDILDQDLKTKNSFGFYAKQLAPIPVESLNATNTISSYSWQMGDNKYTAKLSLKELSEKKDIVPSGDAPAYDQLWRDKTLHGIIVTGSNQHIDIGGYIIKQYKNYYKGNHFQLSPAKPIADLSQFLKERISDGSADYLIKEAHSDGDEKNLFRIYTKGILITATKNLPGGKKEVVDLIYPADTVERETKLISNADFANWLNKRSSDPKSATQFVYLNGSCWSITKALNEIEATANPILLDIASTTENNALEGYKNNAKELLLSAFREGKNYEQIRQALLKNHGYAKGLEDKYIFPDDPEYKSGITDLLKTPLDIQLTVLDDSGKELHFDEIH